MSDGYQWVRLTHPLTGQPMRDHYGWVSPGLRLTPSDSATVSAAPLSACRDIPVVVLRAERGSGKTNTLADEFNLLRAENADTVQLDLADDVIDVNDAVRKITAALTPEAGSDRPRFVFLDSLDNAIDLIDQLTVALRLCLAEVSDENRRRLRLRIACRTTRWPQDVQRELERLWPADQVQHRALAGLTRGDVMSAARQNQVEAEAFLDAIEARGLVPLAGLPVTLLPMLRAAKAGRPLPSTASEAYAEGCRTLCVEQRDHNDGRRRPHEPGQVQLLTAATRVAAMLQLGRRDAIVADPTAEPGPRGLTLAELEGGVEPTDQGGVGCTAHVLDKLTESALFAPLGSARIGFAHHSFQEFLAARYLAAHAVPLAVLKELFIVGDGPARHVVPWQREVAGWLAGVDRGLFETLLVEDPEVLLVADLAAYPERDRARVIDALIALTTRDDTVWLDPQACRKLDHPGLAGQLANHLRPRVGTAPLSGAVAIAGGCDVPALAGALLDIAEHPDLEGAVRRSAIGALPTQLTARDQERLRRLTQDADPEPAGVALLGLARREPTLTDLLSTLVQTTAAANYVKVMTRDLATRLTWADLPAVLDRCIRALEDDTDSAVAESGVDLLVWATGQLSDRDGQEATPDPEMIEKVVAALLTAARRNERTGHPRLSELTDQLAGVEARRALAGHALAHASTDDMRVLVYGEVAMVRAEDSSYWAQRLPDLPEPMQHLLEASVVLFPPASDEDWEQVYELRQNHPLLARMTEHWYVQPLANNHARMDAQRRKAREQRVQAERDGLRFDQAAVDAALAGIMAGTVNSRQAWWRVALHLHRSADGDPPPFHLDLRRAPSFVTADGDLSTRLRSAAHVVLTAAPEITVANIRPLGIFPGDVPELTALALLDNDELNQYPAMTPGRWAGITIALLTLGDIDADDTRYRDEILPGCAHRAGHLLETLVPLLLDRLDDNVVVNILSAMAPILDDALKEALLKWARARGRSVTRWSAVTRLLAKNGDPGALRNLRRVVRTDPTAGAAASTNQRVDRWLQAANILIDVDFAGNIEPIWEIVNRDTAIGDRLIDLIAGRDIFGIGLVQSAWPEQQLGWLYEQLLRRSPATSGPAGFSGFIGPAQRLEQLRNRVPEILATRLTAAASAELKRLADAHPAVRRLRVLWRGHVKDMAALAWQPLRPSGVAKLVAATDRRVVHDARQLRDVVTEACDRLQAALSGPNGLATLLWNRDDNLGANGWWPSWEDDLSDLVATFLRLDLSGHQVVINREVEVVRRGLAGQRLDIAVQANPLPGVHGQQPVTVIVECKGCWNDGLPTDLEQQLVDRYLTKPEPHAGIFLVGFFDCEAWKINRGSRLHAGRHTLEDVRRAQTQAARAQEKAKSVSVTSIVLDCRLPERPPQQPATTRRPRSPRQAANDPGSAAPSTGTRV